MVTLAIPPKDPINKIMGLLNDEFAQAASIKSKQTMTSVQSAITSTREKLKLYRNTPTNGLIVFCGTILMDDNKTEKKLTLDIEPFRPAQAFMYKCDVLYRKGTFLCCGYGSTKRQAERKRQNEKVAAATTTSKSAPSDAHIPRRGVRPVPAWVAKQEADLAGRQRPDHRAVLSQ